MRLRLLLPTFVCLALPVLLIAQGPPPTGPAISNVTPNPVTVGNTVTLTVTGTNFCSSTFTGTPNTVLFHTGTLEDTPLSTTTVSTTQLTAVLPASVNTVAGTGVISVEDCSDAVSAGFNITIAPQPTITQLTPSSAAVGGPGFNLTITGTSFISGMTVSWCLNSCAGPTSLTPSSISATQIVVAIPSSLYNVTGSATVAAIMPDGFTTTAGGPFTIYGTPAISSLLPNAVPAGSAAFTLAITGTNFATNDAVLWNGSALSGASFSPTSGQITVTVPATLLVAPGTANVTVQDPGGAVSSPALFTIAGPSISSLSPASAATGSAGFTLNINGANFVSGSAVTWTPQSASAVPLTITSQTAGQIQATVPSTLLTTAGTATVTVTNPGGSFATATFTVTGPTITSLSPSSIPTGSAAFNLVVTGTNFVTGSVVRWGSTTLTTVGTVTATQITASVPSTLLTTSGSVSITVQNPGGATSNASSFSVSGPTLTSLSSTSIAAGSGGFNLTATGTNFATGAVVFWGTTALSTVGTGTATQIVAAVPSTLLNTAGPVSITVQNPGGVTSNAITFTVNGPSLTSLSQTSIPAGSAGFNLTATGTNFASAAVVYWGATALSAVGEQSSTQIVAAVPSTLLTTAGPVSVTVKSPGGATSNAITFTVSGPTLTSLSSTSATSGSPAFNLTVTGTNFATGATVHWGATTLTTVGSGTATQIVAAVTQSLLNTAGAVSVTVQNPGGATSNALTFTVGGPTLTSLSATSISTGSATFNLTATGTNFSQGAVIRWGSTALSTVGDQSATQVTASVPSTLLNTPGPVSITVQNPGGATSNALTFTVNGPTLTSLSATSISSGSAAFNLTATGTNFAAGAAVYWGATALATVGAGTATQITATVPATLLNTAGPVSITVQNSGGSVSNALTFTVNGPTLTSLSATSISSGSPGFNLTVTGTNFTSGAVIRWGNTSLTTASGTTTQITAPVPSTLLGSAGPVSITVQNPGGASSNALTFTVNGPAVTSVSPTTIPSGSAAFTLTVTGTNFVSGSVVHWNSTALPAVGSATSTQIAATVAASLLSSQAAVSITVQNPGGATSNAATFTVGVPNLAIATPGIGPEVVNVPYSITLQASGGVPPYTWSASGLPQGFSLTPGGLLSGTSATVTNLTITVQVADSQNVTASKTYTLRVTPPNLSILTETLPHGVVGVAYSQTLSATGGAPAYTWSINQGTLPPGLSLEPSGLLSGTPTKAGSSQVGVLVTDSANSVSGRLFTLVIDATGLTITTASLPDGAVGSPYSAPALQASGGTPPYTWSLGSGSSSGFTIGSSSGAITGTAQSAGPVTFVVQVTDSNGVSGSKTFTVNINNGFTITTAALNGAAINVAYPAVQLTAAGGTAPYKWSISAGALPAGMTLDAGGTLSGTPTAQGESNFTVQAQDANGQKATKQFQIVVATPVVIGSSTPPDGTLGKPYSIAFSATGGAGPYTWSVDGSLPGGVTLNTNGTLAGTPIHAGTFTFTVTATDAAGRTDSKKLTLKIASTLAITTTSITGGVAGSTFTAPVQAAGGTPPYTFSATGLPSGVSINPGTGQIGGTPAAAGPFTAVVTVTDGDGQSISATYKFNIALPSFSGASIGGVPPNSGPAQQPKLSVTLNSKYPLDITGTLTLTFASSVGGDDQMVQFSTGGRTVTYTIPAGSTDAVFSNPQGVSVLTGTVAGTITITTTLSAGGQDITPSPIPTQTIVIAKSAPVITSLKVTRNSTGFDVVIAGYSTTRDMTQATFQFTAASGATLQSSSVTVQLNSPFATWYGSAASNQFGSQFTLTVPFTIQGGATTVTGLTATLTNSAGTSSPPASANF